MRLMLAWLTLTCLLIAAGGCGGSAAVNPATAAPQPPAGDATAEHAVSHVAVEIAGSDYWSAAPGGITAEGAALRLHSEGIFMSFAIYRHQLASGEEFVGLGLSVADIEDEFWVCLSDYGGSDSWKFFGPFNKDNPPPYPVFGGTAPLNGFTSTDGYVYWAVLVAEPHGVLIERSYLLKALPPLLECPPRGDCLVDSGSCSDPDLLLVPELSDLSEAGAPLIAYTSYDGSEPQLALAYYNGGSWHRKILQTGRRLIQPQLLRDSTGLRVLAFDPDLRRLVDLPLNVWLEPRVSNEELLFGSIPLFELAADCLRAGTPSEPADEILAAVATSLAQASVLQLMRWTPAEGWRISRTITSDSSGITGVDLSFSQHTQQPTLLFSHGIYNSAGDGLSIDTELYDFRRIEGLWYTLDIEVMIDEVSEAPLGLSLGHDADGIPQVVAIAARDFAITDPITYSSSLLFDVLYGKQAGATWQFTRAFTSTLRIEPSTPPLPPEEAELTLNLAPCASWARPDQLIHSKLTGTAIVDLHNGEPSGGSLASATAYLADDGAGWEPTSYYTGTDGISFCFSDPNLGGGCAYIAAPELDYNDVLNGQFPKRNDLRYWSPE